MYTTIGAYDTLSHLHYSRGGDFFHDRGGGRRKCEGPVRNEQKLYFFKFFLGGGGGGERGQKKISALPPFLMLITCMPRGTFFKVGGGAKVLMVR